MVSRRHPGRLAVVTALVLVGLGTSDPSGARPIQTAPGGTTAAEATIPGFVPGFAIFGGAVRQPGAAERPLSAPQATAFMQSWLPDSIYSGATGLLPNGKFEYSTLEIQTGYRGSRGTISVFFTCRGDTAWVGMRDQELWPGAVVEGERWFESNGGPDVIAAYNGERSEITTAESDTPPTTSPGAGVCPLDTNPRFSPIAMPGAPTSVPPSESSTTTAAPSGGTKNESSLPWVLLGGAAIVIAAGGGVLIGRRRTGR